MAAEGRDVFVIGGRGFVGAHVVRALVAAGRRVHVFGPAMADDRLAGLGSAVVAVEGTVEDRSALTEAMRRSDARTALFLAAHSHARGLVRAGEIEAERALAINLLGFRNVLEAARANGLTRVVWSSSTVVYGPPAVYARRPVDEDAEHHPQSFYGLTKVLAEDTARFYRERAGLEVSAIRLPLVFGPGLWYQGAAAELTRLFAEAAPGREVTISGPTDAVDLIYVKDAAGALLAVHDFPDAPGERYNVSGFATHYSEIAATVTDLVPGYHVRVATEPATMPLPLVDHGRIERELGFQPAFDLRAAAEDYLRSFQETRP